MQMSMFVVKSIKDISLLLMDALNAIKEAKICQKKSQTIFRNMMNGAIARFTKLGIPVPKGVRNANRLGTIDLIT